MSLRLFWRTGLGWVGLDWFGPVCVFHRLVGALEIMFFRYCWAQAHADEGREDGLSPAGASSFLDPNFCRMR